MEMWSREAEKFEAHEILLVTIALLSWVDRVLVVARSEIPTRVVFGVAIPFFTV